jgi:hypothetical protein
MIGPLPNPQLLDELLTLEGVDTYKRYKCRTYIQCMNYAADAGWPQFHCNDCDVYEPTTATLTISEPARVKLKKKLLNGQNK